MANLRWFTVSGRASRHIYVHWIKSDYKTIGKAHKVGIQLHVSHGTYDISINFFATISV